MTREALRVGVVGATGLVGRLLCERLSARGDQVVAFSRDPDKARRTLGGAHELRANHAIADGGLDDLDAVVNLAGEPVTATRWNPEVKRRIRDSRVEVTRAVVEGVARAKGRVKTLVNASAVGFYGPRGAEEITEADPAGSDFLAGVCVAWERAAVEAEGHGARVVRLRIGIVLGDGGALGKMTMPFQLFVGGPIGDGEQFMPWVHIDDVVGGVLFALDHEALRGPVVMTAPKPLRGKDFARALGRVMKRPAWLPVPGFALRLAVGEVAEVLTTGQNALPRALLQAGYTFRWTVVDEALRDALSR